MSLVRHVRWPVLATLAFLVLIVDLLMAIVMTPGWRVASHALSVMLLIALIVVVYGDLKRAQERQRVILEISHEMAAKVEMGDLLDYVVHVTLNLLPLADKCVIHLLDEQGRRLYPRYSSQPDWQQHMGLPAGKGIAGRALRENSTIMINDVTQSTEFLQLRSSPDLRALLVAPLKTQEQNLGTISLNSHVPGAFTYGDQTLMTILASQISSALHQSLLYEQAQLERHYVESVLMNMPDGIAVLDDQDRLVRYNVALAHILGADVARLVGKHVALDSDEIGLRHLAQMMTSPDAQTGDTFSMRLELQQPIPVVVDTTVSIIEDHSGRRETIIMIRDETECVRRIQAEADLMAAAAREIMPGLASIRGYAALLRGSLADQPGVISWATEIQTKGSELADRARDLDFLRTLYADEIETSHGPAHLADTLSRLRELVRPLVEDKEMSLEIGLEGALDPARVPLDGAKLEHALHNLLTNAIHRGYRGGQIDLRVAVSAEDISITVSDNGRALREEERQRIFYGVYRIDGATYEAPAGTGLALYVSRCLVESMRGHLWVEQNQIVGVKISIVLPFEQ